MTTDLDPTQPDHPNTTNTTNDEQPQQHIALFQYELPFEKECVSGFQQPKQFSEHP